MSTRNTRETVDKKRRLKISNGWVSPLVAEFRNGRWPMISKILKEKLQQYCENSSIAGYKYLTKPYKFWIERAMWIALHAMTVCMLGFVVYSFYTEYYEVPVITVIATENSPTNRIDFPAVAVCNMNRISRKAAIKLADDISNATNLEFVDVFHLMKQFGSLYLRDSDKDATSEKLLNDILLQYYKEDYDVTDIMKNLTPGCEEGLSLCQFHGETRNCSEIFSLRKTSHGFCCIFNSAREPDDIPIATHESARMWNTTYTIDGFGITNGLSLVLEPFLEDYYFPTFSMTGWMVMIFDSWNYPNIMSGSVSETYLSPATETFIDLQTTVIQSTENIRSVAFDRRKCMFPDEVPVQWSLYTFSDCLTACFANDTWDMCKCRPFNLPRRGSSAYKKKICNTADLDCLRKNRDLLYTNPPNIGTTKCPNCKLACEDNRYFARSSKSNLNTGSSFSHTFNTTVHVVNQSILHMYFTKEGSIVLRRDIPYYWYDLLSNIGGMCGVFIGFSLISIAEFVYFLFRTPDEFHAGEMETTPTPKNPSSSTILQLAPISSRSDNSFNAIIYWNEFLTHVNSLGRAEPFRKKINSTTVEEFILMYENSLTEQRNQPMQREITMSI